MEVISGTLFAVAIALLIALGLSNMFNVTLPGPLTRGSKSTACSGW